MTPALASHLQMVAASMDVVISIIGSITQVIVYLALSLGTIVVVLQATNLLPRSVARFLRLNEATRVLESLIELGVIPHAYQKRIQGTAIEHLLDAASRPHTYDTAKCATEKLLLERSYTFPSPVEWKNRNAPTKSLSRYVDLQGVCFHQAAAALLAQYVVCLIGETKRQLARSGASPLSFDCIAVHENAAPFLGYEVAQLLGLPLVYVKQDELARKATIVYHATEANSERTQYTNDKHPLKKAVMVADLLMLAPHIDEVKEYLGRFAIGLDHVFLIALRDDFGTKSRIADAGISIHAFHVINDEWLATTRP